MDRSNELTVQKFDIVARIETEATVNKKKPLAI